MHLDPFQLERYFAQHEFTAPYLLCASDCESLTVREVLALEPPGSGAAEAFGSLGLGYTESQGHPELRRAIAKLYESLGAEHILVHAGAEEAIFNFLSVVVRPGDEVIVHAPYYQSQGEVARAAGAEVRAWRGDPENAWELDLEDLRSLLTPRTRAVIVNFPHNPTGFLPSQEFARNLVALAEECGFLLFSDEVYRGLEHDPADRLPALADLSEAAVSLGVLSKTYGLAGLRIGWIATRNGELFRQMAGFKDYTTICNSAPSEFLATVALRHGETLAERNRQIIRTNLDRLDAFFTAHEDLFRWYRPRAGSIAFPTLLQGSVDAFCADLVEKAGVLLAPGTLFGAPDGEDYNAFRIGFGRKNLPEALARLEEYLQKTSECPG